MCIIVSNLYFFYRWLGSITTLFELDTEQFKTA
jgi:hypothetical protein